jgi:hypothetical protein
MCAALACLIPLGLPAAASVGTFGYLGAKIAKGTGVLPGKIAFFTFDCFLLRTPPSPSLGGRLKSHLVAQALQPMN